ncbi:hypothetical protein BY457_1354 [Marinilabilia salmonicolor]|jgi:hypothetical protein|nr:hypothetical protein BY457_1354 [Marinilabilia salmonicolor]
MRLARGYQTRCDFISLKAWERVKQNPQYAVDATAGVYSSVRHWLFLCSVVDLIKIQVVQLYFQKEILKEDSFPLRKFY